MKQFKIGIIGLGPRGLSVLERCIAFLQTMPTHESKHIEIYLFDSQEPGVGCHNRSQPDYFLVNTIASQITQFSDESVRDAGPILTGLSFYEWIVANNKISEAELSPNAYYSRALFGEYLSFVFHYLFTLRPKNTLFHHQVRVDDLIENKDGTWRLIAGEKSFDLDYVYLTTGHDNKKPSQADRSLHAKVQQLQNRNPLLTFIANPYPVVDKLQQIDQHHTVLIEGAGLTTCDIIAELTTGRGGRFVYTNEKIIYQPSGFEPNMTVYSRTGIPLSARGINQKSISGQYKPKFITFEAIHHKKSQSVQLDFDRQILPLLKLELSYAYYYTLIHNQYDLATAEQFSIDYIKADSARLREKIVSALVAKEFLFSWDSLLNPVPDNLNQDQFVTWLKAYLETDIENALQGNVQNPIKAACDVLRDIRDVIRSAVDFAGLSAQSHEKFINEFVPIMNRLAVGPPKVRIQEWLALMEAGILHFDQGPAPQCELNLQDATFMLTATAFSAPVIKADVLIKAKIEMPGPLESESLFMQNLVQRKIVRPFRNSTFQPGGIEVDKQFNIVSGNGAVIKNIWALGILTEGCKFYTFVVPRPGVNSTAIVDAGRAVKQMMESISQKQRSATHLARSGLAATFVGNGIGRFAFISLFPVLIQLGWFDYRQTSYLAAATLFGYFIGAPLSNLVIKRISAPILLRSAMLFCSLSYLVCAFPEAGFYWFLFWRTIAGVCGAILMVLAPAWMLGPTLKSDRNRAAGIIFSGVGLGAMTAGVFVPILLLLGLQTTWIVLGALCLILTVLTWQEWEHGELQSQTATAQDVIPVSVVFLLVAYALNAVGYLPHTLFWVDYITRELHMSIFMGGFFWAIFGVGAVIGPLITSTLANKLGLLSTLLYAFMFKALGVALPLISHAPWALFCSSLLVGILTPGVVNLVFAYTQELTGTRHLQKVWGWLTLSFALTQAVMSYVLIMIRLHFLSYQPLFMISASALLISCFCVILLMNRSQFSGENSYA